jgi:hypothetical protein
MTNKMRVPKKGRRRGNFPTLRLTFSYEGSDLRLISRQRVEMMSPPSDPVQAQKEQTGFWYEVRDAEGRTLYRRVIQNPIKFAAEVRSDDPERPLAWQEVSEPRGNFILLMPDLDRAHMLVLFSSPMEPGAALGPAKEIAHFDLAQGPEGKGVA